MMDKIKAILLSLNAAGWKTRMDGGHRFVVSQAVHRRTGEVLKSKGPAMYAG